ncbi:TPA: ATP-binding cassette domain-containing protein, partial [Legionella pneumophila subsp. pneumophila]|nr:ATP-binding cassette domain-containing protein [Legionella pneumophila subsp. pneumophila]
MNHKPIQFKDLSLIYPHKTCFQDFSGEIHFADRIALIGRNGSGKSTLLKMLCGLFL